MKYKLGAVIVALMVGVTASAGHGAESRNIVLVTIDTLRADHLGLYGYPRPTSPNIDALAAEATVFDAAVPTCPATAPSIASILTGHYRATHGVINNRMAIRGDVTTLAEVLQSAGYRTAGVIASPIVARESAFGQGFETFGEPEKLKSEGPARHGGEPVVVRALAVVDDMLPGPFFLWVHFMDPHGAYLPPADELALFDAADYAWQGDTPLRLLNRNYGLGVIPSYQRIKGQRKDDLIDPAELRARYDAEIHYVDGHVGELIRGLKKRGVWDDSIFVLTADHGESLGEHNFYFQHGLYVYESTLHVPLLIRAPHRVPQGHRVAGSVSLIDVSPTILDLAGETALEGAEGRSAVAMIEGREGDRSAFAVTYYGNRLVALRRGAFKYVYTPPPPEDDRRRSDRWRKVWPVRESGELYDLSNDARELNRLEKVRPLLAQGFREEVQAWLADQFERGNLWEDDPARTIVDPVLESQLKALGYLDEQESRHPVDVTPE